MWTINRQLHSNNVKMFISQHYMITVVTRQVYTSRYKINTYNVIENTGNSTIQIHSKTAEESVCSNIDAFLCIVIRRMVIIFILVLYSVTKTALLNVDSRTAFKYKLS